MLKKVLSFVFVVLISYVSFSINIQNLNGVYDLSFNNSNEYSSIELNIENSDNLRSEVKYNVRSDRDVQFDSIEFYEYDHKIYAVINYGNTNVTYVLIDSTMFMMEFENVEDSSDTIKFVYDKFYNEFDYNSYYESVSGYKNSKLKKSLNELVDNQVVYSYREARTIMFRVLDNYDGYVYGVYTEKKVKTMEIPNALVMNCEHSWPQSKFGSSETTEKKDDLLHIYPADSRANSRRNNHPFGIVKNASWEYNGSKLGEDKNGNLVFEPRDEHKGDVARAMLYFSVRYNMSIDSDQEKAFKKWNKLDPVSEEEYARNCKVEWYQHNRNPFIDRPELVNNISNF